MSALFEPITLRDVTVPNRVWMSPMCQYSAEPEGPSAGAPHDWHFAHYAARATGGTGLILVEATAVSPEGRISPYDLGLWNDAQVEAFRRITRFLAAQGTVPAVQLAHGGRKASTDQPWKGGAPVGPDAYGWQPLAPSPVPFDERHPVPDELTTEQIHTVVGQFARAARRALAAGFEIAEIHGAHGYLINEFLSPHSNHRTDAYGGSYENRTRFALDVVDAVRQVWPDDKPVFFRISATDWLQEGGWTPDDTVRFACDLHAHGVDLLDVSTGGNVSDAAIPTGPGYQVPFAARVKAETALRVGTVGLITEAEHAHKLVANGEADAVLLGRELLRNPSWARHAARELGAEVRVPDQYHRYV
ncbi:2,4-dienoyl-CoA reductase-like NADH-dependent reductase (Old Yellow Enzyme family) [Streptomyces griseochromogenes]|uniref:2,4-dienoyl-CoA reductase-like NADH-dependent reductase (Old Yellow Enzyme family) n=1 Tax=Streptomyces griseochromogenes TaxID=68214 RepID=A0A1B1B325_9ACTN|nr:NADH:flavin oxidoreductase/NADH oxidase [Streptomyces griseochromogenes]ANP53229.1 oxidoreductase [Streptomyces griseochromogenes]MBP2053933.1 2,4-dienoyl-CoA reductase-like NADH-dependent reductase (Old Yellow Enzyme family) [Streptomyces griseochromogenes]